MKNYSNNFRFPFQTLFSVAVVSSALGAYSVRAQEDINPLSNTEELSKNELAQNEPTQEQAAKENFIQEKPVAQTSEPSSDANPQLAQQTVDDDAIEEVLVSGRRINLQNAQEIKRNAATIVDAISAQDIGTLPDRSVLEAIQRIPGVSVERFAGPDDPDHFSVEGSGAIIRGMTQTRSEFNGRDSFTANSGRSLSFQDVPPELMGTVEIFKNQTADMIEGGIGGTVVLHTRKPFNSDGRQAAVTLDYSYGDLAQEWTPTLSGLFSDRWDTDAGEFGFLINIADSTLEGESHGIQSDAFTTYRAANVPGAESFIGEDGEGLVYMPNGANSLAKADSRKRQGLAISGQWASPDGTMEITTEYLRSKARLSWHEHAIKNQSGFALLESRESTILEGESAIFDEQGLYLAGTIVNGGPTHNGWRVSEPNLDHVSRTWGNNVRNQFGHKVQFESRIQDTTNLIEDFSVNFKWQATDKLELVADAQYIEAETKIDDLSISLGSFAGYAYDTRGDTPVATYIEPWFGDRDANPENYNTHPTEGFSIYPGFSDDPAGDSNYFQDLNSYFWRSALDRYERSNGDSRAATIDSTYEFNDGSFITRIKSGIRYAQREQIVRNTGYDWRSLAPEWSSFRAGWIPDELYASQVNDVEFVDWSNFHRGGVSNIAGDSALFVKESFLRDVMAGRRAPINSGGGSWEDYPGDSVYDRFLDGDIYETTETNRAIYTRIDFEGDANLRFSGNIGLRYVKLNRKSLGFVNYPDLIPVNAPPEALGSSITAQSVVDYVTAGEFNLYSPEGEVVDTIQAGAAPTATQMELWLADPANAWADQEINYLSPEAQAFGNQYADVQEADVDFELFLPSFNIKLELSDELLGRFSVAKAAALPDIGDVRNRLTLGHLDTIQTERVQPVPDENGETPTLEPVDQLIQSARVIGWTGSGGNAYLKPMESVQYDFALEWYFSDVGQLSGTIFHKNLSNYFIQGAYLRPITNPSSNTTAAVDVESTINGGDAKMDGLEISYQQFFDGFLDGFGVQATYTYIDASGVPNNEITAEKLAELAANNLEENWVGDGSQDPGNRVSLDVIPLQGQSKETINLVAMYEKGPWNARLAYNWRSKYLLTTRDVISKSPLFYDSYGLLDGSVFYRINDHFEVGIQGTNLLNRQHETIMVINNDGLETGRSWFVTDRRVALILKANL